MSKNQITWISSDASVEEKQRYYEKFHKNQNKYNQKVKFKSFLKKIWKYTVTFLIGVASGVVSTLICQCIINS